MSYICVMYAMCLHVPVIAVRRVCCVCICCVSVSVMCLCLRVYTSCVCVFLHWSACVHMCVGAHVCRCTESTRKHQSRTVSQVRTQRRGQACTEHQVPGSPAALTPGAACWGLTHPSPSPGHRLGGSTDSLFSGEFLVSVGQGAVCSVHAGIQG